MEEIVDPDQPIIDPHHHLWPGTEYYQDGPYYLPELLADVQGGHRIVATVHIEAHAHYDDEGPPHLRPVGETRFIDRIGSESERLGLSTDICAGLVAFADLRDPRVEEVLDAHAAAAPLRFKGIRQMASWHPGDDDGWARRPQLYLDPDFRRGFALLAQRNLSFDTVQHHVQLLETADLATAFPDTTIVVGHLGGIIGIGPYLGRRDEAVAEWKALLPAVAACPNTRIKLGGAGMFVGGIEFSSSPASANELVERYSDLFHWVIDLFGPARCMMESNFPVDRRASGYVTLWNALKTIARHYSAEERHQMLFEAANATYRLGRDCR